MFKEQRKVYEARVSRALSRIQKRIYQPSVPLDVAAWHVHGEPVSLSEALKQTYESFAVGDHWGGLWDTTWFRFRGQIPRDWEGCEVVALVRLTDFDYEGFTAEGLIFREGKLERALNANRADICIASPACGGESFEFFVEAAANGGSDKNGFLPGVCAPDYLGTPRYALAEARITCLNRNALDLYYDYKTALEAMEVFPHNSQKRSELCMALNEAVLAFDTGDLEGAREALRDILSRKNGCSAHIVSGVGHAHIDTAWLWPLREAIRKCARTFSTALDYMERYPEYIFACSQPQQYVWMKVHYPEIWTRIQAAVKRGQWEVVGSMWVEPDCNLPSGESLVRQLLYGKRFFQQEFGVETRDVWMPDVFGYPATLPQIFRGAGIEFFMTQKMSWNEFNEFPHHTFEWEGADGSKVFSHFPPADTYSADTGPKELIKTVTRFREHGNLSRSLLLYGYGDGGGGPSIEMLEKARRLRNFEGLPRLELESSVSFFEKARAEAVRLPSWHGELYLELHRGTFTTQAQVKKDNRRAEQLLREAEFWDVLAGLVNPHAEQSVVDPPRAVYDVTGLAGEVRSSPHQAALERAWKLVLLNQFHDILPGSSIHWVYEDSARDYATVRTLVESVKDSAWSAVAEKVDGLGMSTPLLIGNVSGFDRSEVVALPNGDLSWVTVPSCGYSVIDLDRPVSEFAGALVRVEESNSEIVMENGLVRVVIGRDGGLRRFDDLRRGRSVLEPGTEGNILTLHHDVPGRHEAWELEFFTKDSFRILDQVESVSVIEAKGLRASVEIVRHFGTSRLVQSVVLRAGSGRVDFVTEVDWQEDEKCLQVAFPVQVRAERATYEIQFGHVERPTHANTSWDMAKFEVCAHTWADLSENGFGVSLLNDCKYGHDIHGNTMRLTLLRAPRSPDPLADRGKHQFVYALLPHGGDFRSGGVMEEAIALNAPLEFRSISGSGRALPPVHSFLRCDVPGLKVVAWKKTEDGAGLIVRLYEAYGARGRACLKLGFSIERACLTDFMERETSSLLATDDRQVAFDFAPFQILTLRLEGASLDVI